MSRPFHPRNNQNSNSFTRINGKIRAQEVRVIGVDGDQLGVLSLRDAINQARQHGVDLVEIAPNATPPVCRLVDYGKFRYEQAKKDKEAKKHQHANRVKEVQLSPQIDPHDFQVKLAHAIDFLCEDMKVKISLRFRGREMQHQEFGFGKVNDFLKEIAPYGHPDSQPKLIGRGINVMITPLPRNKRAKNPHEKSINVNDEDSEIDDSQHPSVPKKGGEATKRVPTDAASKPSNFGQNPFDALDIKEGGEADKS